MFNLWQKIEKGMYCNVVYGVFFSEREGEIQQVRRTNTFLKK
jgi:hypothetical protein